MYVVITKNFDDVPVHQGRACTLHIQHNVTAADYLWDINFTDNNIQELLGIVTNCTWTVFTNTISAGPRCAGRGGRRRRDNKSALFREAVAPAISRFVNLSYYLERSFLNTAAAAPLPLSCLLYVAVELCHCVGSINAPFKQVPIGMERQLASSATSSAHSLTRSLSQRSARC